MIKNLLRRKRKAKKDIFETGEFNMNHISFENLSEERDIMVSLGMNKKTRLNTLFNKIFNKIAFILKKHIEKRIAECATDVN